MRATRPAHFLVQNSVRDGRHTLVLTGELDMAAADYLHAAVYCLCPDGISGLALNLSELRFIDATGLRAVLAVGELCRHRGYEFSVTRPTGQVRRLIEVTGLDPRRASH
jgi:anti-sigma B factor antagonist